MTEKFTASNGVQVWITESDGLVWSGLWSGAEQGLREYFQHERDQELGRWRDPENPDWVVYLDPSLDCVLVLDETSGDTDAVFRQERQPHEDDDFTLVADRYFNAHPAPEPRPWEEAKEGEIWELTGAGGLKQLWVRTAREEWRSIHSTKIAFYDAKHATAGRRIWPEQEDWE